MSSIVTDDGKMRAAVAAAALMTILTAALNVLAAVALSSVVGASDEFRALQVGPVAFATTIGMAAGAALLAVMRRRWPHTADRRFAIVALIAGVASCSAPLSMLAADPGTVDGWSRGAVWSLVPLHLIPTVAAAALPRATRG